MTGTAPATSTGPVTRYQGDVAAYWDSERNPVNLRLGDVDGYYHHHYGIGDVDWNVLETPAAQRETAIIAELHRLEHAQANLLLDHLGPIQPHHRLLDAGCGRGGSSLLAHDRFGCHVDGVSLSASQVDFANQRATERGISTKVTFHQTDMLDTGFTPGTYQAIWNNESTMYVDLADLFAAHTRLLTRGGRYVTITGCYNDVYGQIPSKLVSTINAHYECGIHPRSNYFHAMATNRLVPAAIIDLTQATIPYWQLRSKAPFLTTGIENAFLTAYKQGSFQYLLIAADRV